MSVIYKCLYCGKEIESNCVFEGNAMDFRRFIEEKTKELSDKCDCRKIHMNEMLKKHGNNK